MQKIWMLWYRYNLIEYIDNYRKRSGVLWQYYKDESNNTLADSESFKSKVELTRSTPKNGNIKDVKITVPYKYFSNFWRTLEISLINCEINLILTWSADCVFYFATGATNFAATDTRLYVPIVTLSTQDQVLKE